MGTAIRRLCGISKSTLLFQNLNSLDAERVPDLRIFDVIGPASFEAVQVRQQALAVQFAHATIKKLLKKK